MGDVHIEQPADSGETPATPVSDTIDLAEKIGSHTEQLAQHATKLGEHDAAIQSAESSARYAHERLDSLASNEGDRVNALASQLESLAGDVAELKAGKAANELGDTIEEGAEAVTQPVEEVATDAGTATVEAPESIENIAEHEEKQASGFMGFLRKLNIH